MDTLENYNETKIGAAIAICLSISLCFQRLSMAAGSIFLGDCFSHFLFLLYKIYKRSELAKKTEPYKTYYKIFGIMLLCMMPSLFWSGDPKDSFKLICEMFFYRMIPFYIITIFIDSTQWVRRIFAFLIISLTIDSLVAVGRVALGITSRGWGFGGNSLNLASILSMMVPIMVVIIFYDKFDSKLKKLCLIALPCMILGVLAGKSRGDWLTLGIVLPIVMIIYSIKK